MGDYSTLIDRKFSCAELMEASNAPAAVTADNVASLK
jgi:hypothetical protein